MGSNKKKLGWNIGRSQSQNKEGLGPGELQAQRWHVPEIGGPVGHLSECLVGGLQQEHAGEAACPHRSAALVLSTDHSSVSYY